MCVIKMIQNKMLLLDKQIKCGLNREMKVKVYPTPFYTSAVAEDNLSQYPNSLTVGKSDYLKLSMVSLRYRECHLIS